jgi:hypothetical protein
MVQYQSRINLDSHARFNVKLNRSSASLLSVNLVTIIVALWQNWNVADLIWVYWLQSLIIGYFQVLKIKNMEIFTTDRFYINEKPVEPNNDTKLKVIYIFILTYALFHLFYLFFIPVLGMPEVKGLMIMGILYLANHYYSYLENKEIDKRTVRNIGEMMMIPFVRIIPIHITMIFAAGFGNRISLIYFLGLKTIVDLIMHNIEHSITNLKIKINTNSIT